MANNHSTAQAELDCDITEETLCEIISRGPIMSREQALHIEERIRTDFCRRAALLFGSKSVADLKDDVKSDREVAIAVQYINVRLKDAVKRYEGLVDILKSIQITLIVALAHRDDIEQIREEVSHG